MADEYPVTRSGRTVVDAAAGSRRDAAAADPEIARAEIEATRARMSETIDEIEDALLRKKEMIKEKLDVMAPVREQPLKMIGIIFGVGMALGLLTGGSDDDEDEDRALLAARLQRLEEADEDDLDEEMDEDEDDDAEAEAWAAAELWEDRAHRLLRVARAQEAELEVHRSRRAAPPPRPARDYDDEDDDDIESGENVFDRLRENAAERLSGLISEISQRMMRGT